MDDVAFTAPKGRKMSKIVVKTDKAPDAVGPYSQGISVESSRLVFTAGQIALDPDTNVLVEGDIELQTKRVLENLKAILESAGTGMENVVKTTVFLKDMNDFIRMNQVYETYFSGNPPARSAVEVTRLPKEALIMVECVALLTS